MPTYVYECQRCGERFELMQAITDRPRQRCPQCRGKVKRLLMPGGGLIFKGSGFYITDYKRKKEPAEGAAESAAAGKGGEQGAGSPKEGTGSPKDVPADKKPKGTGGDKP